MKYIVCLGDGMADWPVAKLGGQTPLEAAKTPMMDYLAAHGQVGLVQTVLPGYSPGSDVANMGILGYDPADYYTGRSPIEAAALGIELSEDQIACRCNLVSLVDGVMDSFTAHHISTEQADYVIQTLNDHFSGRGIAFHTGVSYRHIAVIDKKYTDLVCVPPHDISDQDVTGHLPRGRHADDFIALMKEAWTVVSALNVSATGIWLWGQGPIPSYPSFQSMTGLTGGIVTAVDLLKGLAKLSGLEAPLVDGATGFLDTNYAGKWAASLDILDRHDFVYTHIEAPDECGHLGDVDKKVQAIEAFDSEIVARALTYVNENPDTRLLVLPDHPTPCETKTHSHEDVPFVMYGSGILPNGQSAYNEPCAKSIGRLFDTPWGLLNAFLR